MRTNKNEVNGIGFSEIMARTHVTSIIAAANDYADSFTVYNHASSITVDVAFEDSDKRYSIRVATKAGAYKIGEVSIIHVDGDNIYEKEFKDYQKAFDTIMNIMIDETYDFTKE